MYNNWFFRSVTITMKIISVHCIAVSDSLATTKIAPAKMEIFYMKITLQNCNFLEFSLLDTIIQFLEIDLYPNWKKKVTKQVFKQLFF